MTANEIAQMVRSEPYHTNLNRNVIADFIDQQADRIAELEKQSESIGTVDELFDEFIIREQDWNRSLKLYTTPQTKPLSDEEIEEIIKNCIEDDYKMTANPYSVARAIEAKVRGEK
jgi:hypothetical protein